MPRQGEGRSWGDASMLPFCQRSSKLPTQWQKLGEVPGTDGPPESQKEQPCQYLDLGHLAFQVSETTTFGCLSRQSPVLR